MRRIYRNFLGWMVAVTALLATSCTDDLAVESNMSGDEVMVSFSVAPQDVIGGTRAGEPGGNELTHISDGKKVNMLIYAVYDEDYKLLPQYGEGLETTLEQKLKEKGIANPSLGEGQTAIYVEKFPVENRILIRLVRGKTYHVAFWAQSIDCKAYNTKDLKRVEAIYGAEQDTEDKAIQTPNNDERRDVFCQVATVNTNNVADLKKEVTLYRPLAQINVGTSGYDFEIATRGVNSKKYRYSKIQISSAARYFSVPENKVLTSTTTTGGSITTEVRKTLNYDLAPIPAYYNTANLPNDPSTVVENEEYLRVNLDDNKTIAPYVSLDQYKENNSIDDLEKRKEANYTETFKYLSMCYILVPVQSGNEEATDVTPDGSIGGTGDYTTTLDNVTVWLAESEDDKDPLEIVKLTNVPVHRNWRTNIIGQELLSTNVDMTINLEPMYSGEFNTDDFGNTWSGPLSADKSVGAYYDAINDEIQISNVEGLLWLERMVNGKYSYKVYDTNGNKTTFSDNGIEDPTTSNSSEYAGMTDLAKQTLKARIMRATHQDQNPNNNYQWPANNNFHFMGAEAQNPRDNKDLPSSSRVPAWVYPAKVRLMADLDLSSYKEKWIPIGFANNTAEAYDVLDERAMPETRVFCGQFDGGNHTIYNLSNKRFSASVYDETGYLQTTNTGPYDKAVQWFAVGLFGQIGQNGSVSNLRMKNVDLFGYCHVGGIAGILTGQDAFIYNCYVDGGTITAAPMYRGDVHKTDKGRTFARGIFAGGIAGYLNIGRTKNTSGRAWDPSSSDFTNYGGDKDDPNLNKYASVQNCDVRNLTIRAYRQIGGIVGALNNYDKSTGEGASRANGGASRRVRKIQNNNVTNVTIIADKFQPYDIFFDKSTQNAFGWVDKQLAWGDIFVGGNPENNVSDNYILDEDAISKNTSSNVIITEFATGITSKEATARKATIETIPLNLMPMLSSFFSDEVTLNSNFMGSYSAYKHYTEHQFYSDSRDQTNTIVNVPCKLPNDLSIDWDKESGKVGMYIESITLNGNGNGRDRTIVTVEDLTDDKDCVAYIGGRNHSAYEQKVFTNWNNHVTNVNSMVFRGQPYAYTGICLAPTTSTTQINLTNVSVYDVYQTLVLDDEVIPSATKLTVSHSNFRGYTNYGAGWNGVTFTNTVFERGANIKNVNEANAANNIQTCEVKANTTFNQCYFKAPYTINIASGATATFNDCKVTSNGIRSESIDITKYDAVTKIEITSNLQGNPVVTYYNGDEALN